MESKIIFINSFLVLSIFLVTVQSFSNNEIMVVNRDNGWVVSAYNVEASTQKKLCKSIAQFSQVGPCGYYRNSSQTTYGGGQISPFFWGNKGDDIDFAVSPMVNPPI